MGLVKYAKELKNVVDESVLRVEAFRKSRRDDHGGIDHMRITRRDLSGIMGRHASHGAARAATTLVQTAEVSAGAFAAGLVAGRFGPVSVGPLSANLLAGLGLHALGLFGVFGRHSDHAHNLADGVLSVYAATLGAGVGTEWRKKKGLSPLAQPVMSGEAHPSHGNMPYSTSVGALPRPAPLTQAELVAMAQSVRR